MAEENKTPEKDPVAQQVPEVKKAPELEITKSIVDKIDFSEAEVALIDTHLQSLEDKVKDTLKNKEAKLILTPVKLAELRKQLEDEGAGDKDLTKIEVEKIIDENDFEENPDTTPPTEYPNNTVTDQISPDVIDRAKEFVQNSVEGSGILPNNFMKKVMEFIHTLFGDGRISLDQSTMFDRQVVPAIGTMGIDIQNAPNKNDIKVSVMQKLAALGVPVEYSDRYFKYIQGSIGPNDIPQKMRQLFDEGKAHYDSLGGSYSSDLKIALETILDFTPTKIETTSDQSAEKSDTPHAVAEKVKIGEKEITGTPEEIIAYTALEKTAKNILGKTFDAKSSLTAVKQGTESELTTISRDVFFKIVSKLKEVYGDTFANSLTGKDITDDDKKLLRLDYIELNKKTPKTMADTLEKNLGNIFWSGVNSLEASISTWSGEDTKKKEISGKLLLSIKGYQSEGTDKGAKDFQPEIAKGYDRLIAQNIEQTSEWKKIRAGTLKDAASAEVLDAYYTAGPTLKTETA